MNDAATYLTRRCARPPSRACVERIPSPMICAESNKDTDAAKTAMPSADARGVPPAPTVMKCAPNILTFIDALEVHELRGIHESASGDVRMAPPSSTATKVP